jgi:cytosine/adenosine deaminase-related metal-dependent hydrolase
VKLAGHAVLPALINAHDHLQLNSIPGLATRDPFANSYDWAAAFVPHFDRPEVRQARAVPADVRHWQGALKNALSGATTVMHHDPVVDVFRRAAFPVRVSSDGGWAHSLHAGYGPAVAASYQATPADKPWFIHLGEGTDARAAGELQTLQQLGCLHDNTVLIHAVALSESDIDTVIAHRAAVIWCPASNLRILGRTLSVTALRRLYDAGRLALGTDSRLSGSRDLLQELQLAMRHSDFCARELLQLVTVHARRLLRMPPASQDLIVIRSDGANPSEQLLQLSRNQLRAVIRDGRPLLTDPDLAYWFADHALTSQPVLLDGQPKFCASDMLAPLRGAWATLEPGLDLLSGNTITT